MSLVVARSPWQEAPPHAPARVHWRPHEKEFLARRSARWLIKQGYDLLLEGDDEAIGLAAMAPFREAVQCLPEERRRYVGGPSQFPWLVGLMRAMALASRGLSDRYRPDVLDEPRRAEPEAEAEPEPAAGPVLVDPEELHWMQTKLRRLGRMLKVQERRFDSLQDSFEALGTLIMEAAPHLAPPQVIPEPPPQSPLKAQPPPRVAVAGMRARDQHHIVQKVGDLAELRFVDSRRKLPSEIGECDWLVAASFVGPEWIRRANAAFRGKLSVVHGMSSVVQEIQRLRRPGV